MKPATSPQSLNLYAVRKWREKIDGLSLDDSHLQLAHRVTETWHGCRDVMVEDVFTFTHSPLDVDVRALVQIPPPNTMSISPSSVEYAAP